MRLCYHIRVRIVHIGKEPTVADIVIIARPQLVVRVVRPVDHVPVQSYTDDLQALIDELIGRSQVLFRIFLARCETLCFSVFLVDDVRQQTAGQLFEN